MTSTISTLTATGQLQRLRADLPGRVRTPGDQGFDDGRRAWNLNTSHRPAVVVLADSTTDVQRAVRYARSAGLGVGVQATGHGTVTPVEDAVLVNTSRMPAVAVDPTTSTARVAAGAVWDDVVRLAGTAGLAGLAGSSTTVGVVGFSLGGGFGWLGRRYGLAAHSIRRAELVTADAERVTVSRDERPELLWGLAGGTGNLGIVTALEFALHPVREVYGGNLYYPLDRARDLLEFVATWSQAVPDELTSAVTFRSFPPLPTVPEMLRGRTLAALRGAYCGSLAEGRALLDQARSALGPAFLDTFAPMPASGMAAISMDPVAPLPAVSHSELVDDLNPATIDTVLDLAGPGAESPLVMVELRQLGGALPGPAEALSPMAHTRARFSLNAIGLTLDAKQDAAVRAHLDAVRTRMRPYVTGETYLNFLDLGHATPERVRAAFTAADWSRLRRLKTDYDPDGVFRFNRNVPPLDPSDPGQKVSTR